jgi:hypothetical protein
MNYIMEHKKDIKMMVYHNLNKKLYLSIYIWEVGNMKTKLANAVATIIAALLGTQNAFASPFSVGYNHGCSDAKLSPSQVTCKGGSPSSEYCQGYQQG